MPDHNELSLLSIRDGQVTWDADQKKAIVDTLGLVHATDADMAVFFHMCRRTQLDPFRKQIYMISRMTWNAERKTKEPRQTFQTGIDGYRVIAERAAARLGVKLRKARFEYYDHDGTMTTAWFKSEPPAMIRATVQLGDEEPAIWDARFSEYVQLKDEYEDNKKTGRKVPNDMWATRPTAQLEKCAEAGALRRACPEDLSNLYIDAEMQRQDNASEIPPATNTVIEGETVPTERDWLAEVATARDHEGWDEAAVLRKIWRDAAAAGELNSEIRVAINNRGAELTAKAKAADESEPEKPVDPGDDPDGDVEGSDAQGPPVERTEQCPGCGADNAVSDPNQLCPACQADPDFQGPNE